MIPVYASVGLIRHATEGRSQQQGFGPSLVGTGQSTPLPAAEYEAHKGETGLALPVSGWKPPAAGKQSLHAAGEHNATKNGQLAPGCRREALTAHRLTVPCPVTSPQNPSGLTLLPVLQEPLFVFGNRIAIWAVRFTEPLIPAYTPVPLTAGTGTGPTRNEPVQVVEL